MTVVVSDALFQLRPNSTKSDRKYFGNWQDHYILHFTKFQKFYQIKIVKMQIGPRDCHKNKRLNISQKLIEIQRIRKKVKKTFESSYCDEICNC